MELLVAKVAKATLLHYNHLYGQMFKYSKTCNIVQIVSEGVCPAVSSAAIQGQQQQQLLLSELKRVGTQQEQLKKAVSEAIAFADAQGESLEIAHLKSIPRDANMNNRLTESKAAISRLPHAQYTQTGSAVLGLDDYSADVQCEFEPYMASRLLAAGFLCHVKGCLRHRTHTVQQQWRVHTLRRPAQIQHV